MNFFIMLDKEYLSFEYIKSEYKTILSLLANTLTHTRENILIKANYSF